jgi:hypothetical protein
MFQSNSISYDSFVFVIYLATLIYSTLAPLLLLFYLFKYKRRIMTKDELRASYLNPTIFIIIWSVLRIYRSIHGIFQRDLIFDMFSETRTGYLVLEALLFFLGNLLPYILVNTKLVYGAYTAKYENKWSGLKSVIRHNSNLSNSALNSSGTNDS